MTDYFDGESFNQRRDGDRLGTQLERVRDRMCRGDWVSVPELREIAGGTDSSVTARIRDLRKERFGSYRIDRRYVSNGAWEYRMMRFPEAA